MPRAKRHPSPTTALTRFNAMRHGLTSDAPVIPGVEDPQRWEEHLAAVIADRAPQGSVETLLAERIASLTWRLRRAARYEREVIAVGGERVDADLARKQRWAGAPASVAEAEQQREDARRAVAILESLLKTPPDTPLAAADVGAILAALADEADEDADAFIAGLEPATRLVATLKALAAREGDDFPELLVDTIAHASAIAAGRELEVARIHDELDRMRRERLLPDAPTLDRLVRYETALNRMLYQALNQLEAMQQRRAGAPTPLHRVQTYGLPGG